MNFFEHQDDARRSTRHLVLLFSLAVFFLIILTNIVLIGALWFFDANIFQKHQAVVELGNLSQSPEFIIQIWDYFDWRRIALVSVVVVSVIGAVIFSKRQALSGGGKIVAEQLGGSRLDLNTGNHREKIALNVVEEMALASGVPVPPIYVLPEAGINAFAAGFSPNDAVIGISQGAIEQLDRDQLQGVVAHEFSHILNGDMRLNINLIAVLAGIMFIGHSGWFLIRMFGGGRRYRSRNNSTSAVALVGLALVAVGAIGSFFGQLIKSAVSRQREFLADASAVQFTRNPEGISGALKMIGGSSRGSRVNASKTEEMSHLFFSSAFSHRLARYKASWFATHPPLDDRIRRIEPRWDGQYLEAAQPVRQTANQSASAVSAPAVDDRAAGFTGTAPLASDLAESVQHAGELNPELINEAQHHLETLGDELRLACHASVSAKAIIYWMLLSEHDDVLKKQRIYLGKNESAELNHLLDSLRPNLLAMPKIERLNILELCIPALKNLSPHEFSDFKSVLLYLIKVDQKIEVHEWLLHRLLMHYLKPQFEKVKVPPAKYRNFNKLRNEAKYLLSHLSYVGAEQGQANYQKVFEKGFSVLDLGTTAIVPRDQLKVQDLSHSVHHFMHLYPLQKPLLLKACAACIQADQQVKLIQFELLRTVAALLDCPMPLMSLEPKND